MDPQAQDPPAQEGEPSQPSPAPPPLPAAAAAAAGGGGGGAAAAAEDPGPLLCFKLTHGYVEPAELLPARKENDSGKPASRSRAFWFHNRNLTEAILLFGNQVTCLIDELPNAYAAYKKADFSYRRELSKAKHQLITLEVSPFNDRTNLFLKKYFKPKIPKDAAPAGGDQGPSQADQPPEWIPTAAVITLDPDHDNPQDLLKFVLSAHRTRRATAH